MAQGSVTKHIGKRGITYQIRIDLGRDPVTGRRRQRMQTRRTRKEAERLLNQWLAEVAGGTAVDSSKVLFGDHLRTWLETEHRARLRPNIYTHYCFDAERHIIPALGQIPLQRLRPEQIARYLADKRQQGRLDGRGGLAPNTLRNQHLLIRKALECAVRWGLLARNPAEGITVPGGTTTRLRTWSAAELHQFLDAAAGTPYEAFYLTAALTGMRRGEVAGLAPEDIDYARGVIHVRRAVVRAGVDDERGLIQEPKTTAAMRTIDVSPRVLAALRTQEQGTRAARTHHMAACLAAGVPYRDYGLLFTERDGTPVHPIALTNRFSRLAERAGLPHIRFHDLRHTHATILLSSGYDVKAVSERLGHASVKTTLAVYYHVLPHTHRQLADGIDEAIFGAV